MFRNPQTNHLLTDRKPRLTRLSFLWAVGRLFKAPSRRPARSRCQKSDMGETFRQDADSNQSEYLTFSPHGAQAWPQAGVVRHDPRCPEGYQPRSSADHTGCPKKTHDHFSVFSAGTRANTQINAEVARTKASSVGTRCTQRSSFAPRLIVLMSYVGYSIRLLVRFPD